MRDSPQGPDGIWYGVFANVVAIGVGLAFGVQGPCREYRGMEPQVSMFLAGFSIVGTLGLLTAVPFSISDLIRGDRKWGLIGLALGLLAVPMLTLATGIWLCP